MAEWLFKLADVQTQLPDASAAFRFHYALRHGTMKLGLYGPLTLDTQGPHQQDELYIVAAGHGWFIKGDERRRFGPHDVIFVEAGVDHRFVDFGEDFLVWVVFWGEMGGEA